MKSIIRISILIALSLIAFIGIFSEPFGNSTTWVTALILSKVFGALAAYATYNLYSKWSKSDKWLAAYDKWCGKGIEEED